MIRWLTIATCLGFAVMFAWLVPVEKLMPALQPLMVALSIMTAAILVRLNRGMPTLDWKSVELDERKRLTSSVLSVTRDYLFIAAIFSVTIVFLIVLISAGITTVNKPPLLSRSISGITGFLCVLCVARMSYVAWRDYDIVRLQKQLIDETGDREEQGKASLLADERLASIRSANLRSDPQGLPKTWQG